MRKISTKKQMVFPNLQEDWLDNSVSLSLTQLTGYTEEEISPTMVALEEKETPIVIENIDDAINAFIAKYPTPVVPLVENLSKKRINNTKK